MDIIATKPVKMILVKSQSSRESHFLLDLNHEFPYMISLSTIQLIELD